MTAAEVVRQHVDENGIKISFLSKKTGIDYELLTRSLSGKRTLKADELILLMTELRLNFDAFKNSA